VAGFFHEVGFQSCIFTGSATAAAAAGSLPHFMADFGLQVGQNLGAFLASFNFRSKLRSAPCHILVTLQSMPKPFITCSSLGFAHNWNRKLE